MLLTVFSVCTNRDPVWNAGVQVVLWCEEVVQQPACASHLSLILVVRCRLSCAAYWFVAAQLGCVCPQTCIQMGTEVSIVQDIRSSRNTRQADTVRVDT
jgi:hypothetical protein